MPDQVSEITIEDLELQLEVYELESEQKLAKLQSLFEQKKPLDLNKVFYEERSGLEIKFQNIVADFKEFLIKQQIASTQKLRKTFYKMLQNPLIFLFKVSRFQVFDLRLNAFDIQLEPIEAINELAATLISSAEAYAKLPALALPKPGREFSSFQQFTRQAQISWIADQIFIFYSYLRKGGSILRKKFEHKLAVVQIYGHVESLLMESLLASQDTKTLKELSILNYEIYLLENSFDVLCFYLKVPLKEIYRDVFKEFEALALKAKENRNYDLFLLIFIRFSREIIKKLQTEGVQPYFDSFIEQALAALLELWSCRICFYKEFLELFQLLFSLHQDQSKVLQICLKNSKQLQKQDAAILRTNFKLQITNKHSELLALLRQLTFEDVNNQLSGLYHRRLYTLQLKTQSSERVKGLLTLLNGNSSLKQFFTVVEMALKEWNHTIDFNQQQKYIDSQFKYPALELPKVFETLHLLNNLCVLQQKGGFNQEYEQLFKANALPKIVIGLTSFLFTSQKTQELIRNPFTSELFVNVLRLLQKALPANAKDWQKICLFFSAHLKDLSNGEILRDQILETVWRSLEVFHIKECLEVYSNVMQAEKESTKIIEQLVRLFMSQTETINESIKQFRLFGSQVSDNLTLLPTELAFLQKNAVINKGVFEPKQTGCFKLTELEITTNSIRFQKVMDNYFFTLDRNSKRFLQFLAMQWVAYQVGNNLQISMITQIISQLVEKYPVSVPILCGTRVQLSPMAGAASIRFAEALVQYIPESKPILTKIVACRCVRYLNGQDYVAEEVLPIILKQIITRINQSSPLVQHYEVTVLCLANSKLKQVKADIILKIIEKVIFEIAQCKDELALIRLSECHRILLQVFFSKKEMEMRKQGLVALCRSLMWHESRNHSATHNDSPKRPPSNTTIVEHILVSPFAISQDYNIQAFQLEIIAKNTRRNLPKSQPVQSIPFTQIQSAIQVKKNSDETNEISKESVKEIDLSGLSLNLDYYFGVDNIRSICGKEGIRIVNNAKLDSIFDLKGIQAQQNQTFVLYYLKEMENPNISMDMVYQCLLRMLKGESSLGNVWTNFSNLRQLFLCIVALLQAVEEPVKERPEGKTPVEQILYFFNKDRVACFKSLIGIIRDIGYTNLWTENSQTIIGSLPVELKKALNLPASTECFFSMLLKAGLNNQAVKTELNESIGSILGSRPKDQNAFVYKVGIDKGLLNLIMRSLALPNLSKVSLIFHSNFNNLRLYTDELHEGLKALNMASKNRSYNEFVQLAQEVIDEEFFSPIKLFKENFSFFIRIEREGYLFKKAEEVKLALERIISLFRSEDRQNLQSKVEGITRQFISELKKLESNIANRVKSFYLVTKLRDLSYQNALTISLLQQVSALNGKTPQQSLALIRKVEIFSLMNRLNNELVLFDSFWGDMDRYAAYASVDRLTVAEQVTICTTRRYGHSMSRVYEACQLQFDQVMQRCMGLLKHFFSTPTGRLWLCEDLNINPAFLTKNFISFEKGKQLKDSLKSRMMVKSPLAAVVSSEKDESFSAIVKFLRFCDKLQFYVADGIKVVYDKKTIGMRQLVAPLKKKLISSETLVLNKEKGLLGFNKYKTSETTLEEIEVLGYLVGWHLFHGLPIDLPLQSALLAALSFGISDLDDLLDVDFKVWEHLKNVMTSQDSKEMNLNFSYIFESPETFTAERIELIEKGASKKVNNQNREQFCDLVCCKLLYGSIFKQLSRFMEAILYICPKEYIACLRPSQVLGMFHPVKSPYSTETLMKLMRKIGVVLPEALFQGGKRIQNLRDYQNIQWLTDLLIEAGEQRGKIWADESNLFIVTTIGAKGSLTRTPDGIILVEHFNSKEDMRRQVPSLFK